MKNLEVVSQEEKSLASWTPRNFEEAMTFAEMVSKTDFAPKGLKGRPSDCLMAMMTGNEVGLKPMQSLQNIAVINGRPSIWGDAALALVMGRPEFEDIIEEILDNGTRARCTAIARGRKPVVREFTKEDAQAAGLWMKTYPNGEKSPWAKYPKRMLQMRARAFAIRDCFPNVLKGISVREEAEDITPEPRNITPEKQEPETNPIESLMEDLGKILKKAEEHKVSTIEESEEVRKNAAKYTAEATLRKFVAKVEEKVNKLIADQQEAKDIDQEAIEAQGEVQE